MSESVGIIWEELSKRLSVFFGTSSLKIILLFDINTEKPLLFVSSSAKITAKFDMNSEKVLLVCY